MKFNNFIRKRKALVITLGVLAALLAILVIVLWFGMSSQEDGPMVNGRREPVSTEDTGQGTPAETTEPPNSGAEPTGTGTDPDNPSNTDPDDAWWEGLEGSGNSGDSNGSATEPAEGIASDNLTCDDFALFSGQYVEDGRDELVENVASILVTNRSGRFLDLATLTYDIDGQTATFIVTGLPPGRSAWVMEASRMTANHSSSFTYQDCVTAFRDDVVASTDKITITSNGNMLTASNNTHDTLENVCLYYRSVHTDGNFFGGITYLVSFGTLEPGASVETLAGHYVEGNSEIIRIGWQSG